MPHYQKNNVKQKQWGNKFNNDFKNGPHQKKKILKNTEYRTSQVVQWIKLCALNAGGPGSIPGQGTR